MPTIKGPITFKKNVDTGEMENIKEIKTKFAKQGIKIRVPIQAKGWKSDRLADLVEEPVIDLVKEKKRLDRELENKILEKRNAMIKKAREEMFKKLEKVIKTKEKELEPEFRKLKEERDKAYEKLEKEAKKEEPEPEPEPAVEPEKEILKVSYLETLGMAELREIGYAHDIKGRSKAEIINELVALGVAG